ncbi:hypothetical protein ACFS07_33190 [Undibacterium arcticum]
MGATEIVIKGEGSELSTTSQDGSTSNGAKTVRTTPFPPVKTKLQQALALHDISAIYAVPGQPGAAEISSLSHGTHPN